MLASRIYTARRETGSFDFGARDISGSSEMWASVECGRFPAIVVRAGCSAKDLGQTPAKRLRPAVIAHGTQHSFVILE